MGPSAIDSALASKRLLFLSNLPTPYQLDFLDRLATQCDVRALFLWSRETNRDWTLGERPWLRVLGVDGGKPSWERLAAELKEFMPDAVVVGGYRLPLANRLKWQCFRDRVSYFYWLEKPLPASGLRAFFRSLVWRVTLPYANGIFCIGSEAVESYGRYAARAMNLPYSIEVSRYRVRRGGVPALPLRCIFVGQYIHRKGVQELLEAFASLSPDVATLSMVGSGELLPLVEEYTGRFGHIRNLGFVEPGALAEAFAEHDLFVLPSRHDGWAVVVAEAMAAALPVIGTSKTGAFVDLVAPNQCGRECEVEANSIRCAIEFYAANPEEVVRHGEAGRQALQASAADAGNAARLVLQVLSKGEASEVLGGKGTR